MENNNQQLEQSVQWFKKPINILITIVIITNLLTLRELGKINYSVSSLSTTDIANQIKYGAKDVTEQVQNVYYEVNKLRLTR